MPEIRSDILLGRWRFRANYWDDLSEKHRAIGSFEMSEACKKTAAIYTECADELQNALSGTYEPLESQRYRLSSEMCPEEQAALMKRHAARTQNPAQAHNAVPTKHSVAQAQAEELLAKIIEDAKIKAEKLDKESGTT